MSTPRALHDAIERADLSGVEDALGRGEEPVFGTLTLAAAVGDAAIVRRLLAAGAFADDATLCQAADHGHVEVIFLLHRAGVMADRTWGVAYTTPLMYAAASGREDAARALVSIGADPAKRDRQGRRADHAARHFGHDALADWLAALAEATPEDPPQPPEEP